jgi:hypothetical protein
MHSILNPKWLYLSILSLSYVLIVLKLQLNTFVFAVNFIKKGNYDQNIPQKVTVFTTAQTSAGGLNHARMPTVYFIILQ